MVQSLGKRRAVEQHGCKLLMFIASRLNLRIYGDILKKEDCRVEATQFPADPFRTFQNNATLDQ